NEWWRAFVHNRSDVVGLDSSIMLHPEVWVASGHKHNFNDPLIDCKNCKARYRADQYIEEHFDATIQSPDMEKLSDLFKAHGSDMTCPACGSKGTFTEPRQFNLMFSTRMGSVSGSDMEVDLRPETAQGIFINFKNIVDSCRVKIPFGVAQIGKSFRNEIIARQFVFRTREFEQMEMEFFCEPGTQKEWFAYWTEFCMNWLYDMGIQPENLRIRAHEEQELSFYSDGTSDIEYQFPFGWGEIWGIASRTDYDLTAHAKHSNKKLEYNDQENNRKYIPYVVEPALGLNRLMLTVLCDAYAVENEGTKEQRTILKLHPRLAPVKAGIFPLQKKDGLPEIAKDIYDRLCRLFPVDYDASGAIGKRYYRQDEIGTPFCITVDYDTKENNTVTVRHRDSTEQERVAIDALPGYLADRLSL
ncbi:MAG: glycine--tRNA ligase, partial [Leptospiraceae bacterium]|nr:glycine--tRNA ligase [Leptospiraceae bacterium]